MPSLTDTKCKAHTSTIVESGKRSSNISSATVEPIRQIALMEVVGAYLP